MKFVEQSYEIIDRDSMPPAELIELCGRICYKSENKITSGSAENFLRMIVKKGHLSVLEHGAFAVTIPLELYYWIKLLPHEILRHMNITEDGPKDGKYVLSGNLRAWLEFLSRVDDDNKGFQRLSGDVEKPFQRLSRLTWLYCTPAYEAYFGKAPDNATPCGAYPIDPNTMTEDERRIHHYFTVRFITNRGVTHELVRHRLASFSQESTRYVNYGGKEMEFIKPVWSNIEGPDSEIEPPARSFMAHCSRSENCYKGLLYYDWRPEQAREVLPHSLKTETLVTANFKEWEHIFSQRTSGAAHAQIRALIDPLRDEMTALFN